MDSIKGNGINWAGSLPLKVGLVGTGYAASSRAKALQSDPRAELFAVTGNTVEKTAGFCQTYSISSFEDWTQLVQSPQIDLLIVCTINKNHGAIARGALEAGKHVIVEYPLALDPTEAEELIALAEKSNLLLHVEHIELLGGLHRAIGQFLPEIGNVFFARYITVNPQHPAPRRWTYHRSLYGFPLTGALSRIHRFTDLFGAVVSVNCQSRYWDIPETDYYRACFCHAQLRFGNGVIGEITYGKGETFWHRERTFELHGDKGSLIFQGDEGMLVRGEEKIPLEVGSRKGLFHQDTKMVLDCLLEGKPLYVSPHDSFYALKVADAARQSAESGEVVRVGTKT